MQKKKFKIGDKVKEIDRNRIGVLVKNASCPFPKQHLFGIRYHEPNSYKGTEYDDCIADIDLLELVEEKVVEDFSFGVAEFNKIIEELSYTHNIKNHDYAGDNYLSNLTASERLGMPAWKGCLIRMQDKMSRLENFAVQDELKVKDESVEDTLKDLAVYSILDLILYRKYKNDKSKS